MRLAMLSSLMFCAVLVRPAWAEIFESGPKQTAVIELFSSEGCSSCPPADAWMSELKNAPGLWKDFIPAAFHVDYWDYLGWKDPFGSKYFSNRQRNYASRWPKPSVYTPGVMMNGKEWRGWRQGEALKTLLADAGILTVEAAANEGGQRVNFKLGAAGPALPRAHAAILGFGLVSRVKSGENRGETLVHDFVVLQYSEKSMTLRNGQYQTEFNLDTKSRSNEKQAIVVWISDEKNPFPVQATGGYL